MTIENLALWLPLLPVVAVLLAAVYLPGTVLLLLLRARAMVAIAGGPLLTAAMLGFGGFALRSLGITCDWLAFLGLTASAWAAALALRLLLLTGDERREHRWRAWLRTLRAPGTAVIIAAGLLALGALWLPVVLVIDPGIPNPKVDPMYHYNVLNAIGETGNVSLNSAVDFNYGLRVGHVMYPTVWHALASLGVPLVGIVPAANVFNYLVSPVVFVIGAGALARSVFPHSAVAVVAALIGAAAFPAFPTGMTTVRAFWPNALANAMLPGLLAFEIHFLRRVRWRHIRRHPGAMAVATLVMLLAALGLGFTHPSILFSAALISVPLLAAAALKAEAVVRRTLPGWRHRLFVGLLIGLPVVLMVLVLIPRRVRSYLLRSGEQAWDDVQLKSVSLLVNWPTDVSHAAGVVVALVYVPLIIGGLVILARSKERRWVAIAWVVGAALIAGSYFPLPLLTGLSGLWYSDTYRLFAVQAAILPLAVAAAAQWAGAPFATAREKRSSTGGNVRFVRSLVVWALIGSALMGTAYISTGAAVLVGAVPTEDRPVMEEAEYAMLERAGSRIPEGSVVVGDPASGVAYLPLVSDAESVFTQVNLRDVDEDGIFLAQSFDRIHHDERVCEILEYYGIQYFYEDEPLTYNYGNRTNEVPGFYGVDISHGFTLVDQGGTAKLWRIDACGPIEQRPEWFERSWRHYPLLPNLEPETRPGDTSRSG